MSKKDKHTTEQPDLEAQLNENEISEDTETETQEPELSKEEQKIAELEESLAAEKDRYVRLYAEFDNYRRRTANEALELRKTASADLISSLLPVLDDFDRAMAELEKSEDKSAYEGVKLIQDKFVGVLKSKGLEAIEVQGGDKFDVNFHEAITQIPAPDKKLKGKIVDVVEKGYMLNEKILRYSKVVTGQ